MRRLLPLVALLALAGCSLNASVTDVPVDTTAVKPTAVLPAGFEGEQVMLACRMGTTDECVRRSVVSDGSVVIGMRDDSGLWMTVRTSECRDGQCYVVDEKGTEWKLEP